MPRCVFNLNGLLQEAAPVDQIGLVDHIRGADFHADDNLTG